MPYGATAPFKGLILRVGLIGGGCEGDREEEGEGRIRGIGGSKREGKGGREGGEEFMKLHILGSIIT